MTRLCALVVYVAALVALLGMVFGLANIAEAEVRLKVNEDAELELIPVAPVGQPQMQIDPALIEPAAGPLPAVPPPVTAVPVEKDTVSGTAVTADGMVGVAPQKPDTPLPLSVPTEAEAEAAFKAAQERYKAMAAGAGVSGSEVVSGTVGEYEVAVFSDPDKQFMPGGEPRNVPLDDIRLVMDVEDMSLREVVNQVVSQAADYTGSWTVKWRLKPENIKLPEERVNLTAEAKFGDFVSLLAERVRNLTGTQLYITAFAEARVILVTDTYY